MSIVVQYFGLSCFKLTSKINDQEVSLITDPYSLASGMKLPRNLEADIVTVSHNHENHNFLESVHGTPFIIRGPGEYENKKVFVYGIRSSHTPDPKRGANTLYRIEMGGLSLAHLGDLGHDLTDQELERLEDVDILFLPVGGPPAGGGVLGAKSAMELVNNLQPRIVIPCHFKMPDLKLTLDPVDKFLREFGAPKLEPQAKIKLARKDLPQEETEVIVMTRD